MIDPAPTQQQQERLRQAAHALGRAGLVHAYGHCSLRLTEDHLLVCAPLPMGLIGDQAGAVVPVAGPLPEGVLGEVRAHQAIYARRPDVGAICRIMPPKLMSLSTQGLTPAPRHGLGAYFGASVPLWDDPRLLRSAASAEGVAEALGTAPAIVMRGNGAIVVGGRIEEAVTLSWFLEDAARVELDVRSMRPECDRKLEPAEIAARQTFSGGVVERMWMWLTGESAPA
jgi:HCOMODA/2-hydroxy-3-carboxy-muconic semialdehyde decarboxylase